MNHLVNAHKYLAPGEQLKLVSGVLGSCSAGSYEQYSLSV